MLTTSHRPRERAFHRLLRLELSGGISKTVVKHHHDVGAETFLDFDCGLRTEEMTASIEMRLELDAIVADVPELTQTENLIAAAVGENRPVPSHELVKTA